MRFGLPQRLPRHDAVGVGRCSAQGEVVVIVDPRLVEELHQQRAQGCSVLPGDSV